MRKIRFLSIYLLIFITSFTIPVFASTDTYERTEENLLIPEDIVITDYNKSIILNTPAVNAEEKIYDFADLYSDKEEEILYKKVKKYISRSGFDLAIVTISENNKETAKAYSQDFYDYNMFAEDGVIFLVDMDTREVYMTTTGRAISMYTDYRINLILDNVYYYMSSNEYYNGTLKYITMVDNLAKMGIPSKKEVGLKVKNNGEIVRNLYIPQILLGSFAVAFIVILIMIATNKMVKKASSSREYLNQETMQINKISDKFLSSNVTQTPIVQSSSNGGSSISRGSSGRSHGGGGHKF